jgi:preprotein translocase subunit SecG
MSLYIFILLIGIVAFLLVTVVMVQNPKGGGLDSNFGGGGANMFGGVQQTTDFLDKATWFLFGLLVVLILVSNAAIMSTRTEISPAKQAIENHIPTQDETQVPMPNPAIPTNKPGDKPAK